MLKKLQLLFRDLEKNKLAYVIWKSLENIDQALAGIDDIDIIFDRQQVDSVSRLLSRHQFIEDKRSAGRVGDDLKAFRGFDKAARKFILLHVHFKCRFGSKELKEFHFPYEREMLKNFNLYQGVKILNNSFFIITRVLLATVKKDKTDSYICTLAKKFFELNKEDQNIIINYLSPYFGNNAYLVLENLKEGNPSILKNYYSQVCQNLKKIYDTKSKKVFGFLRLLKRNKINRPLDIVLAGCDGTGKSSVSCQLQLDLGKISTVKIIYLGRNRWFFLNEKLNKLREHRPFLFLNYIWPITSTLEIILRYCRGKIFKLRGGIVIYDRSLKDLLLKYNKEKFSVSWFPKTIISFLRDKEADLSYLLVAEPEIMIKRKSKHSLAEIKEKQKDYYATFSGPFKVIDTTNLNIKEVSAIIIDNIFRFASGGP